MHAFFTFLVSVVWSVVKAIISIADCYAVVDGGLMENPDAGIDDRRWNDLKRRSLEKHGLGGDQDGSTVRRDAWLYVLDLEHILAKLQDVDTSTFVTDAERVDIPHKDEDQVALDVRRSFIWLGDTPVRAARRSELAYVINGVLRRHPCLRYYQGYHDVVSVLLLVFIPPTLHHEQGEAAGTDALEAVVSAASRISLHVLRDVMTENMTPTMGHLKVMRNVVRLHDPTLSRRIELASALPYFALPWLLSLFAHDVEVELSCRMFDYILLRGPMALLYVCAALVEHLGKGTTPEIDKEEGEDAAELHQRLSQLPSQITSDNLSVVLLRAEQMTTTTERLLDLHTVMGNASVLFTWQALPWSSRNGDNDERRQSWSLFDEQATDILADSSADIVRDAMPSPPAIEKHESALIRHDNTLVLRHWWSSARAKAPRDKRGVMVAWIGAFGALGAAMLLVYGTANNTTSSSLTSGLGTAFPVGIRASSETLRQVLRYALPPR